ncbi:hypothetical protein NO1_1539 [Candidatus Termititenax aidoneus]|uniref:Outer membrane protein n=1 Tax=Termititenax aidoneus TaxID=2218524 RepID=A0A388TC20_TERA1|nr:hypothetical protein NO1_1539 [Candidatus Termititenax aidoneus]
MKKLLFCAVFFPVLIWAGGRTLTGSTGYIMVPNAEALRYQEWNMGLSAFSAGKTADIDDPAHWRYNVGLGWSEWLELTFGGRSEREGLFSNAKWYGAMRDDDDPMLVAFGWENLSSKGTYEFREYPSVFMVVTKKFVGGHSFSMGAAGRYIEKKGEIQASMLAGGELFTSEEVSWVADALAYEDNKYNANFGLRIYTTNTMYFSLMAVNLVRNSTADIDDDGRNDDVHPFCGVLSMTINGIL